MHFWSHCKGLAYKILVYCMFMFNSWLVLTFWKINMLSLSCSQSIPISRINVHVWISVNVCCSKVIMLLVVWFDNIIVAHESISVSTHGILQISYLIKKCSFLQSIAACNFCIRWKFGSLSFISNWCLLYNF